MLNECRCVCGRVRSWLLTYLPKYVRDACVWPLNATRLITAASAITGHQATKTRRHMQINSVCMCVCSRNTTVACIFYGHMRANIISIKSPQYMCVRIALTAILSGSCGGIHIRMVSCMLCALNRWRAE